MSKMGEIDAEMEILRADAKEFQARALIERDVANYWYERCIKLEEALNDALNNRLSCNEGK